jgi:hypothetical protein
MGKYDSFLDSPAPSPAGKYDSFLDDGLATSDAGGGFMPAAKQAIGAGIKGLGQAATDFIPGVEKGNALSSYGQSVIDANPTAIRSLGDIADKPWTAVKEATGNAGGSMASMLGARGVGMAMTAAAPFTGPAAPIVAGAGQLIANVGPFVAAALPSYGGIRGSQIAADPLNEQDGRSKAIALLGAGTVGAIEGSFGPQAWALAAMKKGGIEAVAKNFAAAKSLPGFIGKGALKGAAVEGAEELVQNPVEQIASYQDPTTGESISDTAFSGAMGAIGGGVLGGSLAGVSYGSREQQPTTQQQPAQQPVAPPSGPMGKAAVTAQQSGAVDAAAMQQAMQDQIALRDEQQAKQAKQKGATNEQKAAQGPIAEAGQSISGAPTGLAGQGSEIGASANVGAGQRGRGADTDEVLAGVAPSQTIAQPPIVQAEAQATAPIQQGEMLKPQAEAQAAAPIQQGEITPDGTQAQEAEQATQGRPAQPATAANAAGVDSGGDLTRKSNPVAAGNPLQNNGSVAVTTPAVKNELSGERISASTRAPAVKDSFTTAPTTERASPVKTPLVPQFGGIDGGVPTNKESLSVKEADITEASLDSVAPSSRGFFPDFEGKTYRQIVRHVVEKHGASSYISRGTLFYPSGKPGRDNGYKLPDFAAKYYEELRNPTPPKQSLSVAPAIADPAIDVSTRTDQQLAYLRTNGKPGYKEAAIAEIARRSADNKLAQTPATASDSVSLSSGQGKETPPTKPKRSANINQKSELDGSPNSAESNATNFGFPAISKAMIAAVYKSADDIRDKISSVKFGEIVDGVETIKFSLNGEDYVAKMRGRNRDFVLIGKDSESDRSYALRALLDGDAIKLGETKPPKPTLEERKAAALERRKAKESGGISDDEKQKLLDKKQLYSDMMETKAANGEKIPEQWKVSLSEIEAKLRGDSVGEHVFSLVVEGHPMFDGFPILRNLVPIKVASFSEAERKLFSAQDLYSKIAGERAKAAHAKAIAKTVAQKKAAIAAMQKLDNNGATEDAVETLRSVTIPELQRIAKEAEQKFGAGNVANDKAKEAATKADTKSIAIPDTQELVRRLGVYEKTFSDLVDVKYANLNDPESFAHKQRQPKPAQSPPGRLKSHHWQIGSRQQQRPL